MLRLGQKDLHKAIKLLSGRVVCNNDSVAQLSVLSAERAVNNCVVLGADTAHQAID